jgi:hypothetical protein
LGPAERWGEAWLIRLAHQVGLDTGPRQPDLDTQAPKHPSTAPDTIWHDGQARRTALQALRYRHLSGPAMIRLPAMPSPPRGLL